MKKLIAVIISVVLTLSMSLPVFAYADVLDNDPYHDVIEQALKWGFFDYGAGEFRGDEPALRSDVVRIIPMIEHAHTAGYSLNTRFIDVPQIYDIPQRINWLSDKGIMRGYGNGEFGYSDVISGEQLAVVIYRLRGDGQTWPLPAVNCSPWASNAVHFAVQNGYMDLDTATSSWVSRNVFAEIMVKLAGINYQSEY